MHERERHRIILSAIQEKPVITVQDIAELTEASEATIRRDIAALHVQGKLRGARRSGSHASPAAGQSGGAPV
jgi:DeoR family transcriptional regulator, ulaG and ulaABCDEF operon transcriptional repressor